MMMTVTKLMVVTTVMDNDGDDSYFLNMDVVFKNAN